MVVPSPKLRLKTDNHSLEDKVTLRRGLIRKAALEPCSVLDLFAGEGNIWNEMRRESRLPNAPPPIEVTRYTPVDSAQRQAGQIKAKITPRIIAALDTDGGLSRYNVIDVDTYGDPWEIYLAILPRIRRPTAIFLTRGKVTYGAGRMPITKLSKKCAGIPDDWDVPGKIELLNRLDECQLKWHEEAAGLAYAGAIKLSRVDYYALLVEPRPFAQRDWHWRQDENNYWYLEGESEQPSTQ